MIKLVGSNLCYVIFSITGMLSKKKSENKFVYLLIDKISRNLTFGGRKTMKMAMI